MIHIKSYEEFYKTLKDYQIVVIKFSSNWCGPCKSLGAKLKDDFAPYIKDMKNVAFIEVDTSDLTDFVDKYSIKGIPTIMIYKKGEIYKFMLKDRNGVMAETNKIVGNRQDIDIPKILCKIIDALQKELQS